MDRRVLASPLLLAACLVTSTATAAEAPSPANLVSVDLGLVVPSSDSSMWLGAPANVWATRSQAASLGASYHRRLSSGFWLGGYLETESVEGTLGGGTAKGRIASIGTSWLGHHPEGLISADFGAFIGLSVLRPSDTDGAISSSLWGVQYGAMIGAAVNLERLRVALHVEPMFCWYHKGSSEVTLTDPRVRLKVGYWF
jgi:hypothetical protein